MKQTIKLLIAAAMALPLATACVDDSLPTDGALQSQLEEHASSEALVNAITKHLNTVVNTSSYSDVGYPSLMIRRDVITADMPVADPAYYYFQNYAYCHNLGHYQTMTDQWQFYHKMVNLCNIVLRATDPTSADEQLNLATAHMYRAFAELDMARMYEFLPTGTALDAALEEIHGLTVPIVNELTTEEKSFHNPRAPFYKMYRYILHDLDRAAECLALSGDAENKSKATLSAVMGLKARAWLDLATRFERFPADLAEAVAHEADRYDSPDDLGEGYALAPLGVTTATEAYAQAAACAAKARTGHSLLTEAEWFDPCTGFNSASASSWILAIVMGSSDEMSTTYTWQSWVSFMSPEATWGIAQPSYKAAHMINKALYSCIDPDDWRRYTWIGPDDINETTFKRHYATRTGSNYAAWSSNAPYTGFKFHPGQGDISTSQNGNIVDIPLMRVEEMYFIEAEARAKAEGLMAGVRIFEDLMGSRTGGAYQCQAADVDEFVGELLTQKRIEFWGEGLTYFDLRRLGVAVVRGYTGTNHPEAYRLNSVPGYAAPWGNIYIPRREALINSECLLNPDPATVTESLLWHEN